MATFTTKATKTALARARVLRKRMPDAEKKVWSKLRRDQFDVCFRRQVPLGPYVVDFLCLKAKIVVELDGSQQYGTEGTRQDRVRDAYLKERGLIVLRSSNTEFLKNQDGVLQDIFEHLSSSIKKKG